MQGSDTVSPCDREPCKGDQIAYEQARAAAAAAAQATQNTLDAKPTAAVVGLSLLGAALAGAGGLIVWTGIGTAPGAGLIAAGGASGGGAVKLYKDWKDELAKKRTNCATARTAFITAKDKLMNDCPTECWPRPFPDINCPWRNSSICKKQPRLVNRTFTLIKEISPCLLSPKRSHGVCDVRFI